MKPYVKRCKYCNGENLQDAEKCGHCGRFFVVPAGPVKKTVSRMEMKGWFKSPVLIAAVVLLVSLFFEWLSVGFFGINAFALAKFSGAYANALSNARLGGDPLLALVRVLILLIPAGCVVSGFMVITGRSYKIVGIATGVLPVTIFFLLQLKANFQLMSVIGGGFLLAMLAGAVLIYYSRREDYM